MEFTFEVKIVELHSPARLQASDCKLQNLVLIDLSSLLTDVSAQDLDESDCKVQNLVRF